MAEYQVLYWKEIPAQIKVEDGKQEVRRPLPERFQATIDAIAMRQGEVGTDAYLQSWRWGSKQVREGTPEAVAEAIVAELDAAYPPKRLGEMIGETEV
ncbi:MAG: virulence factor [Candidatus Bipolaricaulia bacterium]